MARSDKAGAPGAAGLQSLKDYCAADFDRGRSRLVEVLWLLVQWLLVSSPLPGSAHRRLALQTFGASIGEGVVLRTRLRVKFPWKLRVGDHSWIGENVWIDNLATVEIGGNCCVSQGAYFCTGSHDWSRSNFDLIVRPIRIGDGAWIAARACIGPGVTIGEGAVLALGSVATKDLAAATVHAGNPAVAVRAREGRPPDANAAEQS